MDRRGFLRALIAAPLVAALAPLLPKAKQIAPPVAMPHLYPTRIVLKVGDDTLFSESYTYRRFLMYERYGFDWPDGTIIYDTIKDFGTTYPKIAAQMQYQEPA